MLVQDGSLISWLREPSDPRVRELNVALEKAREDAQYWHDLARIATEDTDKIKDRYEALQKQSDSFRAVAEKVLILRRSWLAFCNSSVRRAPVRIRPLQILSSGQRMLRQSSHFTRIGWSGLRRSC